MEPFLEIGYVLALIAPITVAGWTPRNHDGRYLGRIADAVSIRTLTGRMPRLRDLAWVPLKDLLIAGVWGVGLFKRTLSWRGNRVAIGAGSRLYPVDGDAVAAAEPASRPEEAAA